ncbi:MAG: 3-deoxy-D-manno-octulosonic acid transferase [Daejeonella sp.]|uniref:3-deoxy-D-manno-octulosonic acid transferase n=1 Tax=Daejeonella sp. JGW-45 TaxID=3034148 RepID=UPI0023EB4EE7|nr:glycosyltransferase N-terminal domain-containing protein [Daejeonella sp. JGW-45]
MLFLYDLGVHVYRFVIGLASLKNKKAAAWINGRKDLLYHIGNQLPAHENRVWFHFASLGEFEQGRPVLEGIKIKHPGISIVITFFSPSGYEVRKDYKLAEHVFYLPLDTQKNASEFITLINPAFAVFTKYEYWYHYFAELQQKEIPLFIVSGIFRKNQPFFKWYGSLHRRMLHMVSHFFVQNEASKELLNTLGLTNVTVTGDTRFDRVVKNSNQPVPVPEVGKFCRNKKTFIAGSTWPEDEALLASLTADNPDWKFIVAPHETHNEHILQVEKIFPNSVKLSEIKTHDTNKQVLIVDSIGLLSNLYQYGDIAYIGGGFGVGIHNTQEAAAFGLPVIFGPNFNKFQEAVDMIELGSAFSIQNSADLLKRMQYLTDDGVRLKAGRIAKDYILKNAGATDIILEHLENKGFFR